MAYVNFTMNEIWNFQNATSNIVSQIDNEVSSYESAVAAAITKYQAAIDVYNESIQAMDTDYRELGFVISDNKGAIETLKRRRDNAKKAWDTAPEGSKASAKSNYESAQKTLENAISHNDDLDRMRDRLWRRMEEMKQSVRVCEDCIRTLQSNEAEMKRAGSAARDAVYQVQAAAKKAHDYADIIVENLKTEGVTAYHHDIRVRFLDHNTLYHLSETLAGMAATLSEKAEATEEANAMLEYSMRDKISIAAVAKMREINETSTGATANLISMAKKSRKAYEYVIDYLNLKMSYR